MIPLSDLTLFLIAYAVLNIIVFCVYARDKYQAKRNAWRTSETMLLSLALVGPVGAFAAMILLHHKTRKLRFCLVPLFLFIHLTLGWYFLYKA